MDLRLLVFMIWGLGTVIVWGDVLRKRRGKLRKYHDARARRDFLEGFGLFLVAASSAVSIYMVLFGQAGTGLRGLAIAVSLGAFFAVGWYARGEELEAAPGKPTAGLRGTIRLLRRRLRRSTL